MTDSWSNYLERPETPAEGRLFHHLLNNARDKRPPEAIDLFRLLFIDGGAYPESAIRADLEWLLKAGFVENDFKYILNRSCYIYINAWWNSSSQRVFIPELIETFQALPGTTPHAFTRKRLRQLVRQFTNTPQYQALQRLALAIQAEWEQAYDRESEKPLETIIHRYPYVYEYNMLTRDSSLEQKRMVQTMRRDAQRQFELDLARYRALRTRNGAVSDADLNEKNPTLLTPLQVDEALGQFQGKVDGTNTHRDLAHQFLTYSRWTRSYRDFKRDLYDYLVPAVHSRFGKHHFNQRLATYLEQTLSQYDTQAPNASLIEDTCKKLLNFLVVESAQRPDHVNFIDLIGNLGATMTLTLLLKIILLCKQSKLFLERRLSILFNHYGARPKGDVNWLIEALENANLAFVTNFASGL